MENIFIILLGLSMVYLASTSRLLAHINMLAGQGWLLFLICLTGGDLLADGMPKLWSLLFIIFETLVVKALVIPMFLRKIVASLRCRLVITGKSKNTKIHMI